MIIDTPWMPNVLGGGDVAGPASATDNAVARFDGTTGKLIQNSTVTIDDSGNITPSGSVHGANGSAANPSFAFNSDQNTGLYRIGADNLGVTVGGVKALDISSTGVTATTTLADQGGTIAAQRNGLAPAQGLAFDGTAGSTVANVPAFGTGDFTVSAKVRLDSLTVSATAAIFGGSGNGFALTVFNSAGSYLIYPRIVYGSAITSVAAISLGLTANVTYTRSSATTGKIYVNGILADTVTDANNYTGVVAAIGSNSAAAEWFWNGVITPVAIENRALSAAEVLALYQSGAVASADYNTASNTAINTATAVNGTGGGSREFGTSFTGASASGFTGTDNTDSARGYFPVTIVAGKRYRVTATLAATNGTLNNMFTASGTNYVTNTVETIVNPPVSGTSYEFVATANATHIGFTISYTSGTMQLIVSNFSVLALGALLAPDSAQVGGGLTWYDVSGNAANITLPATGVSWSLPTSGYITAPTTTALTLAGGSTGASLVLGQGGTGDAIFANSANTGFITGVNNATSGTGAFAALGLLGGARQSFIYKFSQGYTTSGYYEAGALVFENNGTSGAMIFADVGSESMRISTGRNLLIGTTDSTGLTGAGGLKINSTTAGSSSAGALVVTGGISAAGASYFGGAVTTLGQFTNTPEAGVDSYLGYGANRDVFLTTKVAGIHYFRDATGTVRASFSSTAATFSGAVSATGDSSFKTGKFTGALAVDSTSAFCVSQPSASQSQITAYGADGTTQGSLLITTSASDGSPSVNVGNFTSTGLAVTGALSTTGAATFAGAVTVGGNLQVGTASGNEYILKPGDSTATGSLQIQAGAGSGLYGGSTIYYSGAHNTRPGWVWVGLGSGSTRKFVVADLGLGAGSEVFSVNQSGVGIFAGAVSVSGTAATWTSGTGSPESVKTAPVGSLYTRTDGGASTTLYVKESGAGNTGWIAK